MALREHDDLLVSLLFQHQTVLSSVKSFFEDTEWPCVMVGSAFEGCVLPKHLGSKGETAVEIDFLFRLPLAVAGESPKQRLQYVMLKQKPAEVVLKVSDRSVLSSNYIGIERKAENLMETFLSRRRSTCEMGSFFEAMEENIIKPLGKVREKKPGGMEMVSRKDTQHCEGFYPSIRVSFCRPIIERLDEMLQLDPGTWSEDVLTNAQMLFVNLTNWCSALWPTKYFNCYLAIQCEWPKEARIQWIERERFWPSHSVVEEVARSSCYLLPLWENFTHTDERDHVMKFKMTFSVAEVLLFSETEPKEKQCIVVLKSLKEKYFLHSQILSSFSIKMVFFWHLQSTSLPERQSLGRGELLERLLHNFIGFLSEGNLPHFLIPEINLLENVDEAELIDTVKQLTKVKNSLLDCIHSELFHFKCTTGLNEDLANRILSFV